MDIEKSKFWRQIFLFLPSINLPCDHVRFHKKIGFDRFSRFDVYRSQTNKHPDKQHIYIFLPGTAVLHPPILVYFLVLVHLQMYFLKSMEKLYFLKNPFNLYFEYIPVFMLLCWDSSVETCRKKFSNVDKYFHENFSLIFQA